MSTSKTAEVVAGVAGVILVTAGLYNLSRRQTTSNTTPIVVPEFTTTSERTIKAIKDAVRSADEAESQALRLRESSELALYFSGEALTAELERVRQLVRNRQRVESELLELTFNDIQYTPGSHRATVTATERWRTDVYDTETGERIGGHPAKDLPQSEELVLEDGRWKVSRIEHFERTSPELTGDSQTEEISEETENKKEIREVEYAPEPDQTSEQVAQEQIQARYDARERAFSQQNVDAYFDYTAPEWQWRSEDGDSSTLEESRAYYTRIFAQGESRSLTTQIVKLHLADSDTALVGVLVGTVKNGDQGRLIGQVDIWKRRGGNWYCVLEYRLARSQTFSIATLEKTLERL